MTGLQLRDRAAIITGAGSGIGRGLAMEAAARGMTVGICDINAEGLAETEKALRERQVKVVSQVVDVRSAEQVGEFAKACFDAFPSVAEIWANAGIIRYNSALEMNLEDWNFTFDVNLRGVVHCIHAFLPEMVKRDEPAQFVITGSQASFMVTPEIGAYAATKHAVWAIADGMKQELAAAKSKVEVSMLAPPRTATGIISTTIERTRAASGDEGVEQLMASIPTAEWLAQYAMEKAEQRDFLILPHIADIQDFVRPRFAAVTAPA